MVTFCQLLQLQAVYDLAYLATNVAAFVGPTLVTDFWAARNTIIYFMPFVMPLLHVFLTGQCLRALA